jgi:hypothetical protein
VRYDFDSLANLTAGLCPLVGSEEAMALQGRGMTGQRCASHLTTYAACIAAGLPVFVSEVPPRDAFVCLSTQHRTCPWFQQWHARNNLRNAAPDMRDTDLFMVAGTPTASSLHWVGVRQRHSQG